MGHLRYLRKVLPQDALRDALALLDAGEWSADLVLNQYRDVVIEARKADADFSTTYGYNGATPSSTDEFPFSFSSGCLVEANNEYFFTGGGHDDWLGSEVGVFDFATLEWRRTDTSCQYSASEENTDAPFQSGDGFWPYQWPNSNGRFAPASTHMYMGMADMPSLGKVYVHGAATFKGANGSGNGAMWIDTTTGHWDETGAYAAAPGRTNCVTFWLPSIERIFRAGTSGTINGQGVLVDPVNKTQQNAGHFSSVTPPANAVGTIIPDPVNSGFLAYVAYHDDTTLACYTRIDQLPNNNDTIQAISYGNTKPASVTVASKWIYMGDCLPGCTKIAVYQPNVGLWTLDTVDWTWSDQITLTGTGPTFAAQTWNRFFYHPRYDAFLQFDGKDVALYGFKRPAEVA